MKLPHEFYQLPFSFDVRQLIKEVEQFEEADWVSHHEGFQGNSAIPLISVDGGFNNEFKGVMKPTPALQKSPYMKQVLASFNEVLSRSRLMRLAPGAQVPLHTDINYHWYKRVRVHIPITTTENVHFFCHNKQVHMAAGECWIFDSWKQHKVENNSDEYRVHLVVDLAGSSEFWRTIFQRSRSILDDKSKELECQFISFTDNLTTSIKTEKFNAPVIMSIAEVEYLSNELLNEIKLNLQNISEEVTEFTQVLSEFIADWRILWLQFETTKSGWPHYHSLREKTMLKAINCGKSLQLLHSGSALKAFEQLVIISCMNIELSELNQVANKKTPFSAPSIASNGFPQTEKLATKIKGGTKGAVKALVVPHSRNSPCPCGSGKRYKTCHGKMN